MQVLTDMLLSSKAGSHSAELLIDLGQVTGPFWSVLTFPLTCVSKTWAEILTAGALQTWACILDPLPICVTSEEPPNLPEPQLPCLLPGDSHSSRLKS